MFAISQTAIRLIMALKARRVAATAGRKTLTTLSPAKPVTKKDLFHLIAPEVVVLDQATSITPASPANRLEEPSTNRSQHRLRICKPKIIIFTQKTAVKNQDQRPHFSIKLIV